MVLESAGFSVAQNKTKGEVDFEHSRLIRKDTVQLFAKTCRTDRGQAKIIPVLKSVVAAKSGANLWPVLSVHLSNICFTTGNKVCRNQHWIRFPARTSGSS